MNLKTLRQEIDAINAQIIALFAKRLDVARKIAEVKKQEDLPVHDPKREEEQLNILRKMASQHGVSPAVIEEIFALFVDYSKLNMKITMQKEERKNG